jgi:hypothetical protein
MRTVPFQVTAWGGYLTPQPQAELSRTIRADLDEVEKKLLFHAEKLQGIDDRIDRLNRRRNTGDAKEGEK